MNKSLTLGLTVAGIVGWIFLSPKRREHMQAAMVTRMRGRMEHMLAQLPDDAPPKIVVNVLPRLREQNDQILELLREQNALLRETAQRVVN